MVAKLCANGKQLRDEIILFLGVDGRHAMGGEQEGGDKARCGIGGLLTTGKAKKNRGDDGVARQSLKLEQRDAHVAA